MSRRRTRLGMVVVAASFALVIPSASAAAKTVTKTKTLSQCVSTASPIPNHATASASIFIPVPKNGKKLQAGTVTAVSSVAVRLAHTFTEDLSITLVSPTGRPVPLSLFRGDDADGYGTGPNSCGGSPVQFGDSFTTPISSLPPDSPSQDPITGQFRPESPLAAFAGAPARGFWTLVVTDCCSGDTGTVGALSLELSFTYQAKAKKKRGKR